MPSRDPLENKEHKVQRDLEGRRDQMDHEDYKDLRDLLACQ